MPIRDLSLLLQQMQPSIQDGAYIFATSPTPRPTWAAVAVATMKEPEGFTYVLPQYFAEKQGVSYTFIAAWIMLTVHSDLAAVGLTAAVSAALAEADISCNVVAGFYHDHLFIPYVKAVEAVNILEGLTGK